MLLQNFALVNEWQVRRWWKKVANTFSQNQFLHLDKRVIDSLNFLSFFYTMMRCDEHLRAGRNLSFTWRSYLDKIVLTSDLLRAFWASKHRSGDDPLFVFTTLASGKAFRRWRTTLVEAPTPQATCNLTQIKNEENEQRFDYSEILRVEICTALALRSPSSVIHPPRCVRLRP